MITTRPLGVRDDERGGLSTRSWAIARQNPQPQAFDARAVQPTGASRNSVTRQVERASGANGGTDCNLINIQRSQADRSKSLGNQSTDYSLGARRTLSEAEIPVLF